MWRCRVLQIAISYALINTSAQMLLSLAEPGISDEVVT
jgi:hypothetical protein